MQKHEDYCDKVIELDTICDSFKDSMGRIEQGVYKIQEQIQDGAISMNTMQKEQRKGQLMKSNSQG